ncbi:hypothetical protein CC1G_03778 [Coprinopsis cinerea okayama7|uniref:DAGKc domain-containing protein n=1 Tax=Coprinopsis cinerea (strain Okayama-7 / 130 / ATCC MYA-4618 / FGSC 9003) TaxID=240176 RepID=A8NGP1_COPC7|nr:hypothetical protein CC1G_03778 [Coprinopsis cinerea okayama7\|eukprot:XP_001833561.1 hypothetical protein CC1G_03778 [Coprinopsis cinerea okayama7\
MPLYVIYNPVCGNKSAPALFRDHVLPYLKRRGKAIECVVETEREGHAGEVVAGLLKKWDIDCDSTGESRKELDGPGGEGREEEKTLDVILGSGDGTLHEIVNALFGSPDGGLAQESGAKVKIVLVPCGTANALYSSLYPPGPKDEENAGGNVTESVGYKMKAVKEYAEGNGGEVPLSFAVTTLLGSGGNSDGRKRLVSSVVTSTSLHAAILRDSERLREEYPGIERFKIAAQENSDKWYNARVELLPLQDGSPPTVYDPASSEFRALQPQPQSDVWYMDGPFAYFLSTVNVDRLELEFNITALARRIRPPPGSCDIVIVRPLRDPSLANEGEEARKAFVPKLWTVLGGAYQGGKHVSLRYGANGEVGEEGGEVVAEYVRCGGWRWIPDKDDAGAHYICSDGSVVELKKGGIAECRVSTQGQNLVVCASA